MADTGRVGHRSAFPGQHDLIDHQPGAARLHDFPSALHRIGVSEFPPLPPAIDAEQEEESISDAGHAVHKSPIGGRNMLRKVGLLAAVLRSETESG
jgi:hypothetical protein